jgi:hypothetical protein
VKKFEKLDYILVIMLVVLCLAIGFGYTKGTVKSQTSSQPASSTPTSSAPASSAPTSSAPATAAPPAAATTVTNRPMARWMTSNSIFLTTLVDDSNKLLSYLKAGDLYNAEVACPQLLCDIRTLQGRCPPRSELRALKPVPSGYKCPPIPDPTVAADLNAGMSQLESAIQHIIYGENRFNGDLIRQGEAETQAACDTFAQMQKDLQNVPSQPSTIEPAAATPIDTIYSFVTAVQAGDMDVVSTLTGGQGGVPGISMWCSYDLSRFVGHTTFSKLRYVIYHNDGKNASVNVDGSMRFTDPAGFPSVVTKTLWYIDGSFQLTLNDNRWIITALPWYQDNERGYDPHLFPWPGDAI